MMIMASLDHLLIVFKNQNNYLYISAVIYNLA